MSLDEALAAAAANPAAVTPAPADPEEGSPQVESVALCSLH
jgi:hypothetical protein